MNPEKGESLIIYNGDTFGLPTLTNYKRTLGLGSVESYTEELSVGAAVTSADLERLAGADCYVSVKARRIFHFVIR